MKSFPWGRWALALAAAAAIAMWPVWSSSHVDGDSADLDFVVKDMEGRDVRLADFKGRPVILNFWATWCGPCKVEIPALIELAEKYRDEKLVVLGVSVDDTPEDLKLFAEEYKMNYPVLVGRDQNRLQEVYDSVLLIPVTWYIRPDGTVFLKHKGPASREWFEDQLKTMLSEAMERP
jgi:cytochrome c biogenesis protein CcmG/thiol:disulfide interchange protein DsbE